MWTVALGKGIREGVYPYREFRVFGAPLAPVLPSDWRIPSVLLDPATTFDVSGIEPYHEVVLVLITGTGVVGGNYLYEIRWYNHARNALLYTGKMTQYAGPGASTLVWSCIGYVPWEIWENGRYRAELYIDGPETVRQTLYFDITGVPPEPPPPAPTGENVFDSLRNGFISLTQVLVDAAVQIKDNPVLKPLLWLLNGMSTFTSQIAGWMLDGSRWYDNVTAAVNKALSWDAIREQILAWLPWLPAAADWFEDAAARISAAIGSWWEGAQGDVKGWLAAARDEVLEWLESYVNFEALGSWWEERTADVKGWIQSAREALLDAADAMIAPVRDQVNKHSATLQLLTDPGDAALRWLQERIELMIARLW